MQYKVVKWTYTTYHVTSCFPYITPTPAIMQAIINDIRENGYMLDSITKVSPVLNTGEVVELDNELKYELLCKAYHFNDEEFNRIFDYVSFNPLPDLTSKKLFTSDYPMKRIVWINNDAFDDFKNSILNGDSNIDIIPYDYVNLKPGDVIQYTSEDVTKHFDVQITHFVSGLAIPEIKDFKNINKVSTKNIINLFHNCKNDKYIMENIEQLLYRYNGDSGEKIYQEFERIYGILLLQMISSFDFNCHINLIVFKKTSSFKQIILDMPDEYPLKEQTLKKITDAYDAFLQEQNKKKEEFNNRILQLKAKIAQRNKK